MKFLGLVAILLVSCTEQRSTSEDEHYIAAVVEYGVSRDVEHNRLTYLQLIKDAADQSADIVVFPELTLTNGTTSFEVPINGLLRDYPVPAAHPEFYDSLLVSMSEAARANQIYVLLNTRERVDCVTNTNHENCPEAKEYVFNTNVVFDRTGAVIDRYRKINLFGEPTHTPALTPDLGIFETDFGVTFGHFICFDLMFQVPAIQVVQKNHFTDIIFSTMWFSEMPYLTAVQIQEAYAYAMNVNFIAAGANNPAVGSAGSGIYSGKAGALISIMPGVPTTRLLVAKVPKVPGLVKDPIPGPIYDPPSDHDGLRLITDPSLVAHTSRVLVEGFQEFTLVDKDVSCTFKVKLDHRNGDTAPYYRAVVQDGSNTYSKREIGVASCLLVACKSTDFESCLYRFDPKQTKSGIQELEINMRTYSNQYNRSLQCDNVVYFPVSFTTSKFPLAPINVTFINTGLINEEPKTDLWKNVQRNEQNGQGNEQSGQKNEKNGLGNEPSGQKNEKNGLGNEQSSPNNEKNGLGNEQSGQKNEKIDESVCEKHDVNVERNNVVFKINSPQDELEAFGIWGRIYMRDVDHNKDPSDEDIQAFHNFLDVIYDTYKYRATAFSGVRSFSGVRTGGSRVCSVVACTGDTMDTCGQRFETYAANSTAHFEELQISATFPTPVIQTDLQSTDSAVFPVGLMTSIMPLEPDDYEYELASVENNTVFKLTLSNFGEELYTFGVWGRVFATDGEEADPAIEDSAVQSFLYRFLLVPVFVVLLRSI